MPISDTTSNLAIEDMEDTNINFLKAIHKEYKEAKSKKLLIHSSEIKNKISLM